MYVRYSTYQETHSPYTHDTHGQTVDLDKKSKPSPEKHKMSIVVDFKGLGRFVIVNRE